MERQARPTLGPEMERGGLAPTRGPEMERGGLAPTLGPETERAAAPTLGPEMERGGLAPTLGPEMERGGLAPTLGADVYCAGDGGKVAFLCPGQGSQKPGMLAELFVAFPRLARWLELGGAQLTTKMFPPTAFGADEVTAQTKALTDTRVAQPALGVADLAVADLLASFGVRPDMIAGHSYGELAALCIAGFDRRRAISSGSARRAGEYILAAAAGDPGIDGGCRGRRRHGRARGRRLRRRDREPQLAEAIGDLRIDRSDRQGARTARLPRRSRPSGSRSRVRSTARSSPARATALGVRLAQIPRSPLPQVPVWSNTTAAEYPSEPAQIRALLAEQVAKPVRFAQQIEAMYRAGARVFVEAGPGQVLTRLVDEILGDRPHVAIACDAGDAGIRQFLRALAVLAANDAPVDTDPLFWDRDAAIIDLDTKPARVKPWLVNGHRTRPVNGDAADADTATTPARELPRWSGNARPSSSRAPSHGTCRARARASPAERDTVVIEVPAQRCGR